MQQAERPGLSLEVAGNRLTLLADGPERLEALLELIEGAKESLRFLYYMFMDDCVGHAGARRPDRRGRSAASRCRCSSTASAPPPIATSSGRSRTAGIAFCRFSPKLRPPLSAPQPPEAGAGRRRAGDHRRLQRLRRLFRNGRIGGLARHRPAASRATSVACLAGYFDGLFRWTPEARRPDPRPPPDAPAEQRHPGQAPLAVRRARRAASAPGRARCAGTCSSARRLDLIAAYFAPSLGMLRRLSGISRRGGRVRHGHRRQIRQQRHDRGGAQHLLVAAAARRRDFRISADQAPHQIVRGRRRRPYRLGQFRHAQPVPQPRDDASHRRCRLRRGDAPLRRRRGRRARRPITLESHRRNRTWLNRLRWAIGYFIVAVADYRIAKRLNFRDVGLPRPQRPRRRPGPSLAGLGGWAPAFAGEQLSPARPRTGSPAARCAIRSRGRCGRNRGAMKSQHLGRELVDQEGAARAQRLGGLLGDLRADAGRKGREGQAGEDVVGILEAEIGHDLANVGGRAGHRAKPRIADLASSDRR